MTGTMNRDTKHAYVSENGNTYYLTEEEAEKGNRFAIRGMIMLIAMVIMIFLLVMTYSK